MLVVGAGPAGAIAALTLARAGVRVAMVDRARFPRDKLCGDTINPGTLSILRRLGADQGPLRRARPLNGMVVTTASGQRIAGAYPDGLAGIAVSRRHVDQYLLEQAVAAGAEFDEGVTVQGALVETQAGDPIVRGIVVGGAHGRRRELRAPVTIAADGRHSRTAFGLGLARHPARPRRWAVAAYFDGVADLSSFGEMHVRPGYYVGVAPLDGQTANVCVVASASAAWRRPTQLLRSALERDPALADRVRSARQATPAVTLGPLAVDAPVAGCDGLLLAGDAAGFVDPMTGDGLRFAVRGAELAAQAALRALEGGASAHGWLTATRRAEFRGKWRFNRVLRRLVGSGAGVGLGAIGARVAPSVLRAVICAAGDVRLVAAH